LSRCMHHTSTFGGVVFFQPSTYRWSSPQNVVPSFSFWGFRHF
jgi:hypothetical protein